MLLVIFRQQRLGFCGVFIKAVVNDPQADDDLQDDGGDHAEDRQHLRNADVSHHQTVGTQSLYKRTLQTIPADVEEEDLSVIAANLLGEERQQDKAQQAPDGFIQKRRVHRQHGCTG